MPESEIHKQLSRIGDSIVAGRYPLNPDNHDQVHVAIGLLNAESAEKVRQSVDDLAGRITGMATTVSQTMQREAERIIESNERVAASNDRSARILTKLTWILVAIGIIQVIILLFQILSSKQ